MRRSTELLMGSAVLLCYMALLAWLLCLSALQNDWEVMALRPVLPAAYLLGVYYINYAVSGKGPSLSLYVGAQLLLAAAGAALLERSVSLAPGGLGTRILLGVLYAGGVFMTAFLAAEGLRRSTVLMWFDVTVMLAVTLLAVEGFVVMPAKGVALLLCLAAVAASLAAMIASRVEREGRESAAVGDSAGGRLLIALLMLLIVSAALLLAAFASGTLRGVSAFCLAALRWCIGALKTAGLFLLGLLERLLLWLASLTGEEPMEEMELDLGGGAIEHVEEELGSASLPSWLGYVLLAAVAVGLVLLLRRLRRESLSRRGRARLPRRTPAQKRESGLAAALRQLLSRWGGALRYRWKCLRGRNSAPGLLAWCESHAPRSEKRRRGESGSAFLLRLAGMSGEEAQRRTLRELSALVERDFYSGERAAASPELCKAVRRCRFPKGLSKSSMAENGESITP